MINSTGSNTGGQSGRMSESTNGTDQDYHKREAQSEPPRIPNYWIEAMERERKRTDKEQRLERELERELVKAAGEVGENIDKLRKVIGI